MRFFRNGGRAIYYYIVHGLLDPDSLASEETGKKPRLAVFIGLFDRETGCIGLGIAILSNH